jgi:hypothetical protein
LFVPSFFAVLQRFEEWRKQKKSPAAADEVAASEPADHDDETPALAE